MLHSVGAGGGPWWVTSFFLSLSLSFLYNKQNWSYWTVSPSAVDCFCLFTLGISYVRGFPRHHLSITTGRLLGGFVPCSYILHDGCFSFFFFFLTAVHFVARTARVLLFRLDFSFFLRTRVGHTQVHTFFSLAISRGPYLVSGGGGVRDWGLGFGGWDWGRGGGIELELSGNGSTQYLRWGPCALHRAGLDRRRVHMNTQRSEGFYFFFPKRKKASYPCSDNRAGWEGLTPSWGAIKSRVLFCALDLPPPPHLTRSVHRVDSPFRRSLAANPGGGGWGGPVRLAGGLFLGVRRSSRRTQICAVAALIVLPASVPPPPTSRSWGNMYLLARGRGCGGCPSSFFFFFLLSLAGTSSNGRGGTFAATGG